LEVNATLNSRYQFTLIYSGVIVATAVVPEPQTLILATMGMIAFVGWARCRTRHAFAAPAEKSS
jgi:hypothetical protein